MGLFLDGTVVVSSYAARGSEQRNTRPLTKRTPRGLGVAPGGLWLDQGIKPLFWELPWFGFGSHWNFEMNGVKHPIPSVHCGQNLHPGSFSLFPVSPPRPRRRTDRHNPFNNRP